METKICVFEDNAITFLLEKDNNVMVNATEMAKIFDKKVENFTRIEQTQDFIKSCLKFASQDENKTLKSVFSDIKSEEDLIISRQKSGTFMHRILALKFAAWLNPDFEVWIYATIERLLFGKYVERDQSFERTLKLRDEQDKLKNKLPEERTGEDFNRFLEIEQQLNRERVVRKSLTKESISGMRSLFEGQEDE